MTHPFTVSTAAAAGLLIKAARISSEAVALVADIIEDRLDIDSCSWDEFGNEGLNLAEELRKAVARSQRARQAARARRSAEPPSQSVTPSTSPVEPPFEMRRTSRGMEKFYRWPDRSWRRTPPPSNPDPKLIARHRRKRS